MTQDELVAQLGEVKVQLEKSKTEVTAKLDELATLLASQGTVTPEVEAALNAVKEAAGTLDGLIPDAE